MQVTHNGDAEGTTEPTPDDVLEPNNHPLPEGQDQLVLALDLRRVDPGNPDGSPAPDLAAVLSGQDPAKAQALSFLVDSIAELLEFDPSLSRVGFTKIVDFEPGTGSATLDEFRDIVNQLTPYEVLTEQPIELGSGTAEEAGTDESIFGDDGELLGATPEPVLEEVVEDPPTAIPEELEDIPHDQATEEAEAPSLPDEVLAAEPDGTENGASSLAPWVDDIDVDGIEG